jgi:SSS family transporter
MQPSLSLLDTWVVAAYLAGTVALGMWIGRGNRGVEDFLLGGRNLPWWVLLGSIVATETSTATFLSVPGLSYAPGGDFRFLQLAFGYIVGRALVVTWLLPGYFRGEFVTAYQLLRQKFGQGTQRLASGIFLVARNVGDGLRLYLTALAVREAVGLSLPLCVIITGLVTLVYTLFGGMRSVVWNDCVQLVIYLAAALASLVLLIQGLAGGLDEFWSFAAAHHKWRLFDLSCDPSRPYTLWAGVVGGAFLSLGTHGADQMMVQRCLAARNRREAGAALLLSGVVVLVQFALFLALGVGLAAFFAAHPPAAAIDKPDAAYATFIVHHLPRGLVGLTLAGLLSAAMSTLSSSLNSSVAAVVGDFGPLLGLGIHRARDPLLWGRLLTIVFGAIQIGLAMAASRLSTSVVNDALAIAGFTAGILFGVFGLGLLPLRVRPAGALTGMVTGLAVLLCIKFGPAHVPADLPAAFRTVVAWPWYPVIGSVTTMGVGFLVSRFLPEYGDTCHGRPTASDASA